MRDRVLIPQIPLQARVGCRAAERSAAQPILVDLELLTDLESAGRADILEQAVDYVAVRATAEQVATERPYRLIESIAVRMARRLLDTFPAEEVRVRVMKPGALTAYGVPWAGVEVVRSRRG